jgi:hypothetical protein
LYEGFLTTPSLTLPWVSPSSRVCLSFLLSKWNFLISCYCLFMYIISLQAYHEFLEDKKQMSWYSRLYPSLCSSVYSMALNKYWVQSLISSFSFWVFLWNILTEFYFSLVFLTGCDRLPIKGLHNKGIVFRCPEDLSEKDHPRSVTCHNILDLPKYSTMKRMKEALRVIINNYRGFKSPGVTP